MVVAGAAVVVVVQILVVVVVVVGAAVVIVVVGEVGEAAVPGEMWDKGCFNGAENSPPCVVIIFVIIRMSGCQRPSLNL